VRPSTGLRCVPTIWYYSHLIVLQALDRSILNMLPHAEGAGYRAGNHEICLDGTRIAELELIKKWEADSTTKLFYYLSGIAGSGKSTIAQTFAERCCAEGRLGASFFCSRDFQDRRNIRLIFPTLAYYLALQSPEFRTAIIPIISKSPDIGQDSLAVQFEDLIIRPLQLAEIHDITIIIDALDECDDKEPVSAILSVMARHIHKMSSFSSLEGLSHASNLDSVFDCCDHTRKYFFYTRSIGCL
jgi:NACHT domain